MYIYLILLCVLHREAEYSQATAELIKEAGQVRAESGRMKSQLEASQWDLKEVRRQLREKEASLEGSETSIRQELATRTQQVYSTYVSMGHCGMVCCRFWRWRNCYEHSELSPHHDG